ncbi:hypothetical protein IHE45_12G002200 [Dioscorea alata]|uniref:Uncharacterized protein n=1 Tax=Dioscorea alata TaxID=55571 RepID=A0ACB7V017_DIOAL|nr:hypothetical protein IHE45_12G002200 [Dioscorea alata]
MLAELQKRSMEVEQWRECGRRMGIHGKHILRPCCLSKHMDKIPPRLGRCRHSCAVLLRALRCHWNSEPMMLLHSQQLASSSVEVNFALEKLSD